MRRRGAFVLSDREQCRYPDQNHHEHNSDENRPQARFFFPLGQWRWLNQAAHAAIVRENFYHRDTESQRKPTKRFLSLCGEKYCYSPPTISPSILMVGQATGPRNSRSLAISAMFKKMSFKFPATVISSTGYASSPPEIQRPDAPRE